MESRPQDPKRSSVRHYFNNLKLSIYCTDSIFSLVQPDKFKNCNERMCFICCNNDIGRTKQLANKLLLASCDSLNQLSIALQALNQGADINCVNEFGESVLMKYINIPLTHKYFTFGAGEILDYYLTNPRLNINYSIPVTGITALEYAFLNRKFFTEIDIVKLLLDHGANINGILSLLINDRCKPEYISEILTVVMNLITEQKYQLSELSKFTPLINDICLIITDYSVQHNLNDILEIARSQFTNYLKTNFIYQHNY